MCNVRVIDYVEKYWRVNIGNLVKWISVLMIRVENCMDICFSIIYALIDFPIDNVW